MRHTRSVIATLPTLLAASALAQNTTPPSQPPAPPASQPAVPPIPTTPSTANPPGEAPLVAEKLDSPQLYQIKIEPRAWYVSAAADLILPGSPANTPSVSMDTLNLDSPRLSPSGDVTIRFDRWSVNLSASATSGDRSTVATSAGQIGGYAFNPGDPIRSSLDFIMGEASVGYSLGPWSVTPRSGGRFGLLADVSIIGGLRMYDVDIGVGATSPNTTQVDEFFVEPMLGARLEMDFSHDFSIDVQSTFGYFPGDRESSSWDIQVAGTWRPVENLGVQIGYRNIFVNLENGDGSDRFDFEGGLAGLFAGVQIRF